MSLSSKQIELIQATIPVLRENGAALTDYFYNRMLSHHPDLREVFNLKHQRTGAQARALAGAVLAYAQNITQPENLTTAVSLIAHKHVSLNIQPEQYAIVGEHLLHSISEVLNIPMDNELISAWAAAYGQLADILIQTEQTLYQQHQHTPHGWSGWKAFKIINKQTESSEITSFYLQPADGSPVPAYQPGQYISVRVLIPELNLKQPRQYSLSEASQPDYFRISVKQESSTDAADNNHVSAVLHQHYQVGDIIEISHPTGDFILKQPHKANVFISGGVGITPMMAMLKTLSLQQSTQHISFIHACRNSDVLAMQQEVQSLAQNLPNLHTYLACEQPSTTITVDKIGRLTLQELNPTLLPPAADYYICGPKNFMQQQYHDLIALGIATQNIHIELFGTGGIADIAA